MSDQTRGDRDSNRGREHRGGRSEGSRSRLVPLLRVVARRRIRLPTGAAIEAAQTAVRERWDVLAEPPDS